MTSLIGAVASAASFSEDVSRAGKWEVFGFGQGTRLFDIFSEEVDILGGGLGVGYNFSDHFNLNGEFSINNMDSTASNSDSVTLYQGRLTLDYNILKGPVTPVLSIGGGVGFPDDSDAFDALYDGTVGAGVRWDANEHIFVKGMLRASYYDVSSGDYDDDGKFGLGFVISVGYKF